MMTITLRLAPVDLGTTIAGPSGVLAAPPWAASPGRVGVGSKFTMALWVPAAMVFSPFREHRPLLTGLVLDHVRKLAALCCFPILWWNVQNDWVTFRHVGGRQE